MLNFQLDIVNTSGYKMSRTRKRIRLDESIKINDTLNVTVNPGLFCVSGARFKYLAIA